MRGPPHQEGSARAPASQTRRRLYLSRCGSSSLPDAAARRYHWRGNVRELENTIERAVLVCDGSVIHAHHLPPTLQTAEASGRVPRMSLTEAVESYEKDMLQDALKTTRGNGAKAAKLLNTTERVLHYKVQKYGIILERYRS